MENSQKIIKSFSLKESLNPKIWTSPTNPDSSELKENIRLKLLEISNQFQEFIGLEIFVSDIHMTGSLANFNWSEFSDIDLHLIVDFSQFSEKQKELYTELFKLKKTLFNLQHNIKIFTYDVELYVQDESEEHTSSGVYSVLFNEWIVTPKKEDFQVDKKVLLNKVNSWITKIDETIEQSKEEKDLENSLEFLNKLRKKIKEYRSTGLSKGGEFSYENLVFKFLRRNGYIEKLFNFENDIIDKRLSLEHFEKFKKLITEASFSFDPGGGYSDPTFGLPQGSVDSGKAASGGDNGNWGGSMSRALAFAKVANDFMGKNVITSQKRSRKLTASGNVSDHFEGNSASYAVDLACRGEQGDRLLAHLMKWFGHPEYTGNRWFNVTKNGYRYQIGWKVPNHYDHIHVGVRKTGGSDTPSDSKDQKQEKKSFKEKLLAFFGIDKDKSESDITSTEKQQKIDDPKRADMLSTSVDDLYDTLESIDSVINQQERGKTSYQKQVESVQVALTLLGYELPKFGVDGLFGSETASAIKKYKEDKNIKESVIKKLRSFVNETTLQNPLDTMRITSDYGPRNGRTHAGIDLGVPSGTNVKSPADGVVLDAETRNDACGGTLKIDHGGGYVTRYCHLKKINVSNGDSVKQGEVVALSGGGKNDTGRGRSTGPHLHFEVYVNGRVSDPKDHLNTSFDSDKITDTSDKKSSSKQTITPELIKQLISDLKSKGVESEDLKKLVDVPQLGVAATDEEFYKSILTGIGAPITDENMKFLYAWRQAEGGSATNNPFNTTYKLTKDENMSNYNSVGVKNYSTRSYGLEATIKTLKLSYYTCIVDGLKNDVGAEKISRCSDLQKWGTGELVAKVVDSYNRGSAVKPKPIPTA